jgi:histidine triad (HIT) family protein
MKDCLFCKIIEKEIPTEILYEDTDVVAFLDIKSTNKGHVLVLPKKHYKNFLETHKEEFNKIFGVCQKIAKAQMKALNAGGFNIMINNNKVAGQLIDHLHVHVIPRFENDGLKHWPQGAYNESEKKKIFNKIKGELK